MRCQHRAAAHEERRPVAGKLLLAPFGYKPAAALSQKVNSRRWTLIEAYITIEYIKLGDTDKTKETHISSAIIESLFGSYKEHKSPNAMKRDTKQIFFLPLLTRMKRHPTLPASCSKDYLEYVSLSDLATWQHEHLSENRTAKRKKY
ncbi:MAG: hypothetical protein LBD91_02715 [Prevotellaceae bacterium]|nr:hypothetical protein [Prevotellaceae bacterium]